MLVSSLRDAFACHTRRISLYAAEPVEYTMIPLEQYQAEEEQSGTVASKEERLEAEARGNTERGDPYEDEHDRRCGGHGEDAGATQVQAKADHEEARSIFYHEVWQKHPESHDSNQICAAWNMRTSEWGEVYANERIFGFCPYSLECSLRKVVQNNSDLTAVPYPCTDPECLGAPAH